jgi:hypothetical protein
MKKLLKPIACLAIAATVFSSCKKKSSTEEEASTPDVPNVSASTIFSILGTSGGAYYLAQTPQLTSGSLTFVDKGTQLAADQAARIIRSGDFCYSLNYGTGILTQLQPKSDGSYTTVKEINAGLAVGTNKPRFGLANNNTIMVYNVVVTAIKNTDGVVTGNTCTMRLASIAIPSMSIANLTQFNVPQSDSAKVGATIGYHPIRVDAPIIAGDKIYFGLMHQDMYNPALSPPARVPKQKGLETLVFDYPSISNGKLTTTNLASGHTVGYRSPSMYKDEKGDVYQSNWYMKANKFELANGDKTVITRLKDGKYDESYLFNVSDALGLATNVGSAGWFYVGNGIGYMAVQLEDQGDYFTANSWSVVRLDVYNKTAVKLNVPQSMLFSYENAVVNNGKFYMAISPIGGEANVYEFDPSSSSPDAFKKGLKLDGGNLQIEGIY